MRRIWCIGSLLAAVFMAACNSNKQVPEPVEGPSPALSSIDSLMWVQPDSALACLLPYFDTCCRDGVHTVSTYNRHYAHLLLAELLYKNDYAQTNRTELLDAVGYFDSLTFTLNDHSSPRRLIAGGNPLSPTRNDQLFFLSARAHYINGVGYYEHDSVVEACKEYMKALEVMEEHFEEEELVGKKAKFMALTYSHLTSLFSDLYLHEQAIYFGKESLKYYHKYDAQPWHIAWILNEIGSRFDISDNYDSAYFYYSKGLKVLTDTTSLIYRGISSHLAFLSYEMGISPSFSISQLHKLLLGAENEQEYASRCLTIGEIYFHERNFDSAWLYLELVYNKTNRISSKKQAAEWLAEIGELTGKNLEASEFARFLVPFANVEENQSSIKSQLSELYNLFRQNRLQQQHFSEVKTHTKQYGFAIIMLLLIAALAITFIHIRSKRQKHDFEKQIEVERHAHQMQQAALGGRLKRSNAALKEQSRSNTGIITPSCSTQQTNAIDYVNEPICQQILSACNDKNNPIKSTVPVSAYADIALSNVQIVQLKDAALRHYGQLFNTLKQRYPELKERDFFYFYLCLLGLDNVQISVVMQLSYRTIWEREKRLQHLFQKEERISLILFEMMTN